MKRNLFYLLMMVCSLSIFVSCKDDDKVDQEDRGQLANEIVGTYKGDLTVTVDDIPLGTSTQSVYITKESNNNVKLELKNFSISIAGNPISVGDITIANIPLNANGSAINLEETSADINHQVLGQLSVKVSGSITNGKADLRITVKAVTLGQNIEVTFKGDKSSSEVDTTDYAEVVAAWYKRESLDIAGDKVDDTWPKDGIEISCNGFNNIEIKSFYISFPSAIEGGTTTQQVHVDSVGLIKSGDDILIDTVRMALPPRNEDTAHIVLSGKFQGENLTLNMSIKGRTLSADYVFKGLKRLTGVTMNKMTFDSDLVLVQPEISAEEIDDKHNYGVAFYVKDEVDIKQLKLVPQIEVADGATLRLNGSEYVKGTAIDFSKDNKFTIIAQSEKVNRTYILTASKFPEHTFSSDFESWLENTSMGGGDMMYQEPVQGWSSSNGGVAYMKGFDMYNGDYIVTPSSDAKSGSKAARLETIDTKGIDMGFIVVPKVTSGSVFTGSFSVNLANTLKSTHFGQPCFNKPVKFQGSYKYTPGAVYYNCTDPNKAYEAKEDKSKTDTPAINAVLYEVDSYAFDYLDGTNLLTSSKIVAIASVKDAGKQDTYKDFEVSFDFGNKKFDSSKKYKLAIVCSSSKDGDKFSGAPGSVLFVDDLKVTFE